MDDWISWINGDAFTFENEERARMGKTLLPVCVLWWFVLPLPSLNVLVYLALILSVFAGIVYFKLEPYRVDPPPTDKSKSAPTEASNGSQSPKRRLKRSLSMLDRVETQTVNPFVNPTWRITEKERIRLSVAAVTLFPVRVIIVLVYFFTVFLITKTTILGLSRKEIESAPLQGWRRGLVELCRPLTRLMLFFIGYYYIPTTGKKASRKDASVVIANHTGHVDALYLFYMFAPMPVAGVVNLKSAILAPAILAIQSILVDRKDPESRRKTKETLVARTGPGRKHDWQPLLIFPEGTCTNGQAVISFKPGGFLSGAPVQPVLLRYKESSFFHPAFVEGYPSVTFLFFRLLTEPVHYLNVEFLDVYKPSAEERADPKLYASNVRAVVASGLGVPTTNHTYQDVQLRQEARKLRVEDAVTTEVQFAELHEKLNVSLTDVKSQLKNFQKMDKRGKGTVNLAEFREFYGHPDSTELANLFYMLDENENGEITYREYLVGAGLLNVEDDSTIVRTMFRMISDDDERLTIDDLRKLFTRVNELSVDDIDALVEKRGGSTDPVELEEFTTFVGENPTYITVFKQYMTVDPNAPAKVDDSIW